MVRFTSRQRSDGASRWVVARPIAQFALIGLAAVIAVGLATLLASRRIGQREAITDARTTTLVKAQGLVEPVVDDGLVNADPASVAAVDRVVQGRVVDSSLVRVKIWRPDGTIVYSNVQQLEGQRFALGDDELDAIRNGTIEADVSNLKLPENRFDQSFGKLLEVYLPIRTPNGDRLLFEAYYRYSAVTAAGNRVWRSFAPVTIGALVVLELLQIPLAWSLARRLRDRQEQQEALLRRALDSSDIERRRIAADLHDGVVQDLVGVGLALAATARTDVDTAATRALNDAAETVRHSVTALRSAMIDIYPPDLQENGLAATLDDLVNSARSRGLAVELDDTHLRGDVPASVASLLYRTAREALRNVVSHASASTATVRVGADSEAAWVEVVDDGTGFDPATIAVRVAEGHLGLRGLQGLAGDAGGTVDVRSAPGAGTTVRVEVPVT